jgi:hypothetical protein
MTKIDSRNLPAANTTTLRFNAPYRVCYTTFALSSPELLCFTALRSRTYGRYYPQAQHHCARSDPSINTNTSFIRFIFPYPYILPSSTAHRHLASRKTKNGTDFFLPCMSFNTQPSEK